MSRGKRTWVFAAIILIVVGALISAAALATMKFDFNRLSTRKTETKTYTPAGDFDELLFSLDVEELRLLPSEDGKCRVVCVEDEGTRIIVSAEGGILSVQSVDARDWFESFGVNTEKTSVTVYLPKESYGKLTLRTSTGDVFVPGDFRFKSLLMTASKADMEIRASVEESISIQTSTGSIDLGGLRASSLDLTASTGHIRVSDCEIAGKVSARVSTGKVAFTDLKCAEAEVKTSTGNVELVRVLAAESLRVETTTGNVRFDRSDAPEIYVETDTGDVTGTLLSSKIFEADTDTGRVKLPRSDPGGRCTLKSDTGDFEIEIAG